MSRLHVHLMLIAAQICFASLAIIGRETIMRIPPGIVPLVRTGGAALVFAIIAWRRGSLRVARRDIPFLALCALTGLVLNQELFIHGLRVTGAINATVLGSTIPVFTVIFAIVLGKEAFAAKRGIGIGLAFAGVAYLVGIEEMKVSGGHFVGNMLVLGNAMSYGLYLVIVRKVRDQYDPLALIAMLFLLALPMVVPVAAVEWQHMPALNSGDYVRFGFLIAVPTVAAYWLVQSSLKYAEASLVASYIYLQPVLVTIGAMVRLGEQPSMRTLVAAPVVLAGVFLATSRGKRPA